MNQFSFPCNSVRFVRDYSLTGRILNPIKRSSEVKRVLIANFAKDDVLSSKGRKFRLLLTMEKNKTWTLLVPPFEVGGDPWTAIYRDIPRDLLVIDPTYPALCPADVLQSAQQAPSA